MTNDLNTIPTSVRDLLPKIYYGKDDALQSLRDATALIKLLCQPNIVIVDLDDVQSVNNGMDKISTVYTAALAALKDKV